MSESEMTRPRPPRLGGQGHEVATRLVGACAPHGTPRGPVGVVALGLPDATTLLTKAIAEADPGRGLKAGSAPNEAALLPCLLSSNNSTEQGKKRLSSQGRKSALALAWNVDHLAKTWGLERLGFLTLTFPDQVRNARIAQARFNSLATHVLRNRYGAFVRVIERHKSQALHYHLLVCLQSDIRSNVDFAAFAERDYRTAPKALRDEWAYWLKTAPEYGFGRTELLPIKSNSAAISKYVGKYIGKHLEVRKESDKGMRLVEYSGVARMATTKFAGVGRGAKAWRARVRLFAQMMEDSTGTPCRNIADLTPILGPKWAYKYRDFIDALPAG